MLGLGHGGLAVSTSTVALWNSAPRTGWHGEVNRHTMLFVDGHVEYLSYTDIHAHHFYLAAEGTEAAWWDIY